MVKAPTDEDYLDDCDLTEEQFRERYKEQENIDKLWKIELDEREEREERRKKNAKQKEKRQKIKEQKNKKENKIKKEKIEKQKKFEEAMKKMKKNQESKQTNQNQKSQATNVAQTSTKTPVAIPDVLDSIRYVYSDTSPDDQQYQQSKEKWQQKSEKFKQDVTDFMIVNEERNKIRENLKNKKYNPPQPTNMSKQATNANQASTENSLTEDSYFSWRDEKCSNCHKDCNCKMVAGCPQM